MSEILADVARGSNAKTATSDRRTNWSQDLKNPVVRKRHRESANRGDRRRRLKVLRIYGGDPPKCACCGESNIGLLTIDHINSDGAAQRKLLVGGRAFAGNTFSRKLASLGYPKDLGLQVLCYNCNCGRHYNGGICPHKDPKYATPEAFEKYELAQARRKKGPPRGTVYRARS